GFTVLLFMRDWRSTLVAGIAIPTSIVSTFTFMRYMGFTLNNLTMLGLVLAVGIVIDDAVVVLENIFRHIEDEDAPPMRAASEAAYGRLLAWSLRHRWAIVLVALGTVLSTVPLIHVVGKTFLPQDDQSEFEIDIQTPGGFTLAESSRIFGEIEHHVRNLRGVTDVLTTIGDQTGRVKPGEGDVTTGSLYVRLKDL